MRPDIDQRLSLGRIRSGPYGGDDGDGLNGAFRAMGPCNMILLIIASEAAPETDGWEHVSVSVRNRCPNWQEMCFVKGLFWGAEEAVIQLHPPKSEWINNHRFCLHLFRDAVNGHRLPPSILVGCQDLGVLKP